MMCSNISVSENNLAPVASSTNMVPNKSDSGVEGAASSLDTPITILGKPEQYSTHNNDILYGNNSQTNSLSNACMSSSPRHNHNLNNNRSPRGRTYNNSNNRGNINRRGSFNRRWRGPGYSSDYQPSTITENHSSPGRASEHNVRYKHTCKVIIC